MENKAMEVASAVKPDIINAAGAALGMVLAWLTGLPPLAQALLAVQGADILTGLLCAMTGRSTKSESGRVSSGALFMGVAKKGLEWLVVLICMVAGEALEMTGITGAAMTYMMATELVSLMENLELFGLSVPLMERLLDVAQNRAGEKNGDAA